MIRIVLDTNVLVSGIMAPQSPPAQILRQITEGQVRLLVSEPIKQEAKAVLGYSKITKIFQKQGISQKIVTSTLTNLLQIAITTPGKLKVEAVKQDPSDNIFLGCAVEGQADFIVSGDHHLKDLKTYQGIKIIAPARFLELI